MFHTYNFMGIPPEQKFVSPELAPGKYTVGVEFTREGAGPNHEAVGTTKLYVNDKVVAEGPMRTQVGKFTLCGDGLCVGFDSADAVRSDPRVPRGTRSHHAWHLDINMLRHHDACMRTTLTLDRDVEQRLKQEMRRTGKSLKATVNDALRLGLGGSGRLPKAARFVVEPHAFGFKPGVDLDRMNQLADDMEAEEAAQRLRR